MFQFIVGALKQLTELVEYAEQQNLVAHHALLVKQYYRIRDYSLSRYNRKKQYLH